jgi:hypothetical protein
LYLKLYYRSGGPKIKGKQFANPLNSKYRALEQEKPKKPRGKIARRYGTKKQQFARRPALTLAAWRQDNPGRAALGADLKI